MVKDQTSLKFSKYLLEEAHELQQAIQKNDQKAIEEELGDCLWILAFMINLGEEQNRYTLESVLDKIEKKILHRHQYTLGGNKAKDPDEAMRYYQQYKEEEKNMKR